MATTVTNFLTALGIRLNKTIDANSDPTATQVYQVIYEITDWILTQCIDLDSEIGSRIESFTLADGTSLYRDIVDDVVATADTGWIVGTYSRDKITLTKEKNKVDYSPHASNEDEPSQFYLDANGNVIFLQTPDTAYTVEIPYWYRPPRIDAVSYTISGATAANPCVITTSAAHAFYTGARTYIESVVGMTELNGYWYTVTKLSSTTFSLDGVNSSAYAAYASGGTAHVILPFNGIFDHIYSEFSSIRFQNIEEYKTAFEESWLAMLLQEARKVIQRRKNIKARISR
uniref:Putative tail tubular protein n=1 Tax=viral metagenome TaxID=1070528 RepID=A0A6M3K3S6_9ZZZZ